MYKTITAGASVALLIAVALGIMQVSFIGIMIASSIVILSLVC